MSYYYRNSQGYTSVTIPMVAFTDFYPTPLWYVRDTGNSNNYVTMTYVDATHIKFKTSSPGNKFVTVIGI